MREQIKIYIRSEEKIYLFIEEKIYFYENQDLSSVLESLDEYSLSEEVEISLILHFSYFKIEGMETDYRDNNIKNIENSTPQKLYNKFLFIFFILKAFK